MERATRSHVTPRASKLMHDAPVACGPSGHLIAARSGPILHNLLAGKVTRVNFETLA